MDLLPYMTLQREISIEDSNAASQNSSDIAVYGVVQAVACADATEEVCNFIQRSLTSLLGPGLSGTHSYQPDCHRASCQGDVGGHSRTTPLCTCFRTKLRGEGYAYSSPPEGKGAERCLHTSAFVSGCILSASQGQLSCRVYSLQGSASMMPEKILHFFAGRYRYVPSSILRDSSIS